MHAHPCIPTLSCEILFHSSHPSSSHVFRDQLIINDSLPSWTHQEPSLCSFSHPVPLLGLRISEVLNKQLWSEKCSGKAFSWSEMTFVYQGSLSNEYKRSLNFFLDSVPINSKKGYLACVLKQRLCLSASSPIHPAGLEEIYSLSLICDRHKYGSKTK